MQLSFTIQVLTLINKQPNELKSIQAFSPGSITLVYQHFYILPELASNGD